MDHTNEVLETALTIGDLFTIKELQDRMETKFSMDELKTVCTTMRELHYLNKVDNRFIISYKGTLQNLEKEAKRLLDL